METSGESVRLLGCLFRLTGTLRLPPPIGVLPDRWRRILRGDFLNGVRMRPINRGVVSVEITTTNGKRLHVPLVLHSIHVKVSTHHKSGLPECQHNVHLLIIMLYNIELFSPFPEKLMNALKSNCKVSGQCTPFNYNSLQY